MTELRQPMLEELQRRNFSHHTIRAYIRTVRDFAAYFHKPPDQLGVEEVRQFQLHMLRDQKLATGTVQNRMTAHFLRLYPKCPAVNSDLHLGRISLGTSDKDLA